MKHFRRKLFPYLMLAPTLTVFGIFVFYPALNGLWISLVKWDGIGPQKFVGLKNYSRLIQDKEFWSAFLRTLCFTVISVPLIYVSALGLGLLLAEGMKGSKVFRAVFYWPTMISSIVAGLTWRFLLGEDFGVVNYILTTMGRMPVKWLTDAQNAMMVVIMVTVWSMSGYYMVMFIAGIKAISSTYYEAARIDGGNRRQQFWYITLPLLKPTSLLVIVLATINVIRTYPLVYSLTQGGPAGATRFMVQMIQVTGFEKSQMGYACAMTTILFVVLSLFTSVQFRVNRGGGQDAE